MKNLLITHNDLDGVGCSILASYCYEDNIDVCYETPYSVEGKVEELISTGEYKNYYQIFITDLSISEKLASKVNSITDMNLFLLDHHKTAVSLNKYSWAYIDISECGTSILYNFLINLKLLKNTTLVKSFVDIVKSYDTWAWQKNKDAIPFRLNLLFKEYGITKFACNMLYKLRCNSILMDREEEIKINEVERNIIDYINKKVNDVVVQDCVIDGKSYKIGFVMAEKNLSILGNKICDIHSEIDFVAMLNGNTISLRTNKSDIELDKIAKNLNGGGHQKAAGAPVSIEKISKFIKLIFEG